MRCRDILALIEDYHYGELAEGEREAVRAHVLSCERCARSMEYAETERRLYDAYSAAVDRALELPPEVWTNVAARISRERPSGQGSPVLGWIPSLWSRLPANPWVRQGAFALALIVLSVSATLFAVRYYDGRGGARAGVEEWTTLGPGAAGVTGLEEAIRSIQRAEQEYIEAIRVLTEILEQRRPSLDPALVRDLDRDLRDIDANIVATRDAYHARPTDPELAYFMLAAYNRKVELLQEAAS